MSQKYTPEESSVVESMEASGSWSADLSKKARRQSRVDQFNQLSRASTVYQSHRRTSSAGSSNARALFLPGTTGDSNTGSESDDVPQIIRKPQSRTPAVPPEIPEVVRINDPHSAESPSLTPARNSSQVSLGSMVRDRPLDATPIPDPFPPTSHDNSSGLKRVESTKRFRATTLDVPGLTRSKVSPDGRIAKADVGAKLVIVMVGLPARGKSYITKKLARYLNWQQHDTRIFNVGNTRRRSDKDAGPSPEPLPDRTPSTQHSGDFFSPDNPESVAQREKWAEETLRELLDYVLDGDGSVGILDATNTTAARRKAVMNMINERSNGQLKVLFLESICTDRSIIEANVRLKLSGPDYRHMDKKTAIEDFLLRLRNYEKAYEPISAEEEANPLFQYIKLINVGRKFECGNIKGFLAGQTVFFLLNINLQPRQIWITRHGESTDNQRGRIGGDAPLTQRGRRYAAALARFMKFKKLEFQRRLAREAEENTRILEEEGGSRPASPPQEVEEQNFCVWTSMLRRAIETAQGFDESEFDMKEMRMLNELDPGVCDGMTYQEIKDTYPEEYEARMNNKIRYRYPGIGGESYLDVINRLRPVIVEIERMEDNCLAICHRVVARVLLSYFMNLGRDAIGDLEVPLHTLYVLEPKPYGVDWTLYKYNERFDWFYEMSSEAAQVQSQLRDHKRRYTVVATEGMKLGDDSPDPRSLAASIAGSIDSSNQNAIESDTESEDEDTHIISAASRKKNETLEEAVQKRLRV